MVEVWRQRAIFEIPIQDAVEGRIDGMSTSCQWWFGIADRVVEIDRSRSTGKKPMLGGSLFSNSSGSTPSELQPLVPLQVALSKATMTSGTSASTANLEHEKMNDPNMPQPTPPVHAARLSQLLKTLANAESSVSEVIKSRHALIDGLEKLLETNRSALSKEQSLATQLSERRTETETKKRNVEDSIMKGLSSENIPAASPSDNVTPENGPIARPEVEALTPPPPDSVESFTPVGTPKQEQPQNSNSMATATATPTQNAFPFILPSTEQPTNSTMPTLPGTELPGLSASLGHHQYDGSPSGASAKKRKVDHEEEDYAQFAEGDLDADVLNCLSKRAVAFRANLRALFSSDVDKAFIIWSDFGLHIIYLICLSFSVSVLIITTP